MVSRFGVRALTIALVGAISAVLSGCGWPQGNAVPLNANGRTRTHSASGSEHEYLYVAEVNNSGVRQTEVRSLPDGDTIGVIANFGRMCEDAAGDVYITNGPTITEYAPGSTTVVTQATLPTDTTGVDCSVDPSSGNVAVVGALSRKESQFKSWLGIYSNLAAPPITYSNRKMANFLVRGYDGSGNLFLNGSADTGGLNIALELPHGAKRFVKFSFPNYLMSISLQWDGSYITAERLRSGKGEPVAILRLTVSGSEVTLAGETNLDIHDGYSWVQGNLVAKIVGHNNVFGKTEVGLWHYPEGGPHPYLMFKHFQYVFYPLIDRASSR